MQVYYQFCYLRLSKTNKETTREGSFLHFLTPFSVFLTPLSLTGVQILLTFALLVG